MSDSREATEARAKAEHLLLNATSSETVLDVMERLLVSHARELAEANGRWRCAPPNETPRGRA